MSSAVRRRVPVRRVPRVSVVVALTAVVSLTGCARQTHEAAWPDLVTARQQDAIDREWLPAFLPEQARDIRQRNEPSTGARIAIATIPTDAGVEIPECNGQSTTVPPLNAEWFPTQRGDALTCEDGWMLARNGARVSMWNVGTLEVVE